MALFSTSSAPAPTREEVRERLDAIRRAMTELASACGGKAASGLAMRIPYAGDVQALWFMRSELMGLLAVSRGEASARESVEKLGAMFNGLLPEALRPRSSSLGSGEPDDLHPR